MSIGLITIATLIWFISFVLVIVGAYLTLRHLCIKSTLNEKQKTYPPISVLKPLKGTDQELEQNLQSFFELDYFEYELIFSVSDPHDSAWPIVEDLIGRYPHINATIILSTENIGPNPKINNLLQSYENAKHDWIVISDSNIRVQKTYLKSLADQSNEKTGIVTALVAGINGKTNAAQLESTYLNTFYARSMILAGFFGFPCVLGKSMFFRRSIAERFGGLRSLAPFLAEDYMAGIAMKRLGLDITYMREPLTQYLGKLDFKDFCLRHIRWGRIRKAQAPFAFLLEGICSSVFSGIAGSTAAAVLLGISIPLFLAFHFGIWSICDFLVAKKMDKSTRSSFFFTWSMREIISIPLWIVTGFGNRVSWRGKTLRLRPWGVVEAV